MTARAMGLHHVTAISADARSNVAFYTGLLGLRLVKRSVNQDDPTTYHLYYGDEAGSPGTIMTFFPWQGIRRGQIGTGQVAATAFAIPRASLGWWIERLVARGVAYQGPEKRFDETLQEIGSVATVAPATSGMARTRSRSVDRKTPASSGSS